MEFTTVQNLHFKNMSKTTLLAVVAFSIVGLLNLAGQASPYDRGTFSSAAILTILSILLIVSSLFAAFAFKKASNNYSLIVTTENSDLVLLTTANQQLQKALAWAAIAVLMILIRSIFFFSNYAFALR